MIEKALLHLIHCVSVPVCALLCFLWETLFANRIIDDWTYFIDNLRTLFHVWNYLDVESNFSSSISFWRTCEKEKFKGNEMKKKIKKTNRNSDTEIEFEMISQMIEENHQDVVMRSLQLANLRHRNGIIKWKSIFAGNFQRKKNVFHIWSGNFFPLISVFRPFSQIINENRFISFYFVIENNYFDQQFSLNVHFIPFYHIRPFIHRFNYLHFHNCFNAIKRSQQNVQIIH